MPLRLAAWGYNLRRTLRLLWPQNRFPLADTAGTLSCQPLIFVSAGRSGTTLLRSMLAVSGEIAIPPESYALSFAALQYQAMQEQSWYNLVRLIVSLFEGVESFKLWQMNMNPVYVKARSLPPPERSLARVIDLIFLEYAAQHFPDARLAPTSKTGMLSPILITIKWLSLRSVAGAELCRRQHRRKNSFRQSSS